MREKEENCLINGVKGKLTIILKDRCICNRENLYTKS